jgi:hypothetical protein
MLGKGKERLRGKEVEPSLPVTDVSLGTCLELTDFH